MVEGDMFGIRNERNAIVDTTLYWDTKSIPIQYGPSLGLLVS